MKKIVNKNSQTKTVAIFGAFDILHPGHFNFIHQAKKLGLVTVVIGRDSTIKKIKGRTYLFIIRNIRKKNLENTKLVNTVLIGNEDSPYTILKKIKPDIILLGP